MVVEDGSGISNANAYVSVEFTDDYFSARGITKWNELETSAKEVLIIKATDFIDNVFQYRGVKKTSEQALQFPRDGITDYNGYPMDGVPSQIKSATCEAVNIAMDGTDLFQTDNANGAVTSEKIGDLSFTYDVSKKPDGTTIYEGINSRLRGFYIDNGKKMARICKVVKS